VRTKYFVPWRDWNAILAQAQVLPLLRLLHHHHHVITIVIVAIALHEGAPLAVLPLTNAVCHHLHSVCVQMLNE